MKRKRLIYKTVITIIILLNDYNISSYICYLTVPIKLRLDFTKKLSYHLKPAPKVFAAKSEPNFFFLGLLGQKFKWKTGVGRQAARRSFISHSLETLRRPFLLITILILVRNKTK